MKQAQLINCSGEVNQSELAKYAIDGNLQTKWCDINVAPNYLDFDFGSPQIIKGWKLVNAGCEDSSYITRSCFLQGKNSANGEWKTIDFLSDNKKDMIMRQFTPLSVRYIRLLITQPTQNDMIGATRIYEFEVY